MADSNSSDAVPSTFSERRQRAPTITIDTSAVYNSPSQNDNVDSTIAQGPTESKSTSNEQPNNFLNGNTEASIPHSQTNQQLNRNAGLDSGPSTSSVNRERDATPTPQNLASPTTLSKGEKTMGFLAVPGLRSRQNSIESEDGNRSGSNYSGETNSNTSVEIDDGSGGNPTNDNVMKDSNALTPDPGTEADFNVDPTPFAFSQGQLNKLVNPKSLSAFFALGGLAGLEKGLRTNRKSGISIDETYLAGNVTFEEAKAAAGNIQSTPIAETKTSVPCSTNSNPNHTDTECSSLHEKCFSDRKRIYKDNRLPVKKGKSLLQLMWITFNDKVLILLSIAAAISLGVGLYQTFGTKHDREHPRIEWVEGVAIIAAILIVVTVGSLNDWQKERQFVKLNCKKQDRNVNIIRSGQSLETSVFDVLVGDVMHLEPGDLIPVDGIFIDGHNLKCDESQTTGESDIICKTPADTVYAAILNYEKLRKQDPFILSGATVTEGVGTFLVTATGVNSSYGKTLMSLRDDPEITPLQSKLNNLAEYIAKLGGGAGLILFVVLFLEFLIRLPGNSASPANKLQQFLQIFIVTVTIIVVAVPEGLPLAVTLALAYATTRMSKDNNLVRQLKACEVMGNATAICSDKTGTLTQNKMLVVAGTIGTTLQFASSSESPKSVEISSTEYEQDLLSQDKVSPQGAVSSLHPISKRILTDSIIINSTAFEGEVEGNKTFIGSKTETALLQFARDFMGIGPIHQERSNFSVVQLFPFDSARKCMGVVVKLDNGKYRFYVKGASEILVENCSAIIDDATQEPNCSPLTENKRQAILKRIEIYASQSLRTIAFIYRDFDTWPPKGARNVEGSRVEIIFADIFKQMNLFAIVGIQDPLREGVAIAVKKCQDAGVVVRMVTGDNLNTAKAIAKECGILTENGIVMEGPEFRRMDKSKMNEILHRLQVLARSSPEDKRILVKRLKDQGETVAVTGDGTNDAPALKTADVGFSMGISGTEVAKEASAIILMDDNFSSIVKALMWGRAVNDSVKKFLQFQVTVNITAVVLTFITAVSSSSEESVLTAVQLLWVNLIMDTMAALALATDPPTESILNRKSEPKSAPLITITMWKMIIGQTAYQLFVTLILYFRVIKVPSQDPSRTFEQIPTLVFNTFVWMQIFNEWNNRRLDNKFNIFEGVTQNLFFIAVNLIMITGQVMIVFVGGKSFNVVPLDKYHWAASILLGFLSIPIGILIRLIPDNFIEKMVPGFLTNRTSSKPGVSISDEEEQFRISDPLAEVKDELRFLKFVKGGRLNNLKFAIQDKRDQWLTLSRSGSRSRSLSMPHTPNPDNQRDNNSITPYATPESRRRARSNRSRSNSALGAPAVMAGIIAGSVAGWSPIDRSIHDDETSRMVHRTESEADVNNKTPTKINGSMTSNGP